MTRIGRYIAAIIALVFLGCFAATAVANAHVVHAHAAQAHATQGYVANVSHDHVADAAHAGWPNGVAADAGDDERESPDRGDTLQHAHTHAQALTIATAEVRPADGPPSAMRFLPRDDDGRHERRIAMPDEPPRA